jgi:uncharacterized coiled-coil protein SlyX
MRTLDIKGIKVHIEDEDLAKALEESVAKEKRAAREDVNPSIDAVSERDAEILLKELEEWLAAGRSHVLNQARKELRKQYVGVGDATPAVPFGSRIGAPSPTSSSVSGVVTVPRPPAWLTGVPQVQAATQEIALSNLIEAVTAHLGRVLEEFAAKLAEWVSSVAEGLFQTISDVAGKLAEAHEKLGEKLDELGERLSDLAEKLPAASTLEGEVLPPTEELLAEEGESPTEGTAGLGTEAPAEGAPPEAPAGAEGGPGGETPAGGTEGAEELPAGPPVARGALRSAASQEGPGTLGPEEAAAALFSPQFLAAFARHLSQMTKDVLSTREAKKVEGGPRQVKAQTPFDIAQEFASSILQKAAELQRAGRVEQDLTQPVATAKEPASKGAPGGKGDVPAQIAGAAMDTEVYKHLKAASKSKKGEEK